MNYPRPGGIIPLLLSAFVIAVATVGSAAAQQRTSVIPVDSLARVRMTQSAVEPSRTRGTFLGADSQTIVVQGALVMSTIEGDGYVGEEVAGIGITVAGTGLGTLLGTLIGAASPGERWERVPLPR
jgi:hypothetical protein